jgi:acyl-CoA thioesterase
MSVLPTARHPFDEDTDVSPVTGGVFAGTLSDRWNALGGVVNGGYYVAVTLRALQQVLPYPDPLVVSTFFLKPGTPGPVEIHTDVARMGRRVAAGTARLVQDGKEIVRTTATFTTLSDDIDDAVVLATPPDLPDPDDAIDPIGDRRLPGVTMTDQVEFRYAAVPGWRRGEPGGNPSEEFWIRFKGGRNADR